MDRLDEAIEEYKTGVEKDPSNAQCKQFLERAEEAQAMKMMNQMGGMGGMPGMFGGGMGGGDQNPFGPQALARLKTNPKFAAYFQDIQFKNMFDLCMVNPQMLMQAM